MYENLINYCSSFIALSAIDKEALALNFKHITIKRNDFLLKEGKVCDFIAFVNSGVIRHYHLKDGKEITCDVTLKNSFITDFKSFTQGIPSEYNFQILKNAELFNALKMDLLEKINREIKQNFEQFLKETDGSECFENAKAPNISFDDLSIDFGVDKIDFVINN